MKPYYDVDGIVIYHGDCREATCVGDLIVADPPYQQTSLAWDRWPDGWVEWAFLVAPQMWVFGSLRMFMRQRWGHWKLAQDIVWEKHNGSSFHADRFRRVHEQVAHFYHGPWADLHRDVQKTHDATKRTIRQKTRPAHMGEIDSLPYKSHDGGPRLQRSVLKVRSCHGSAQNETQKPVGIVLPLIRYSCPPGGVIVSPFMGSGTDLVVARQEGRRGVGFDVREDQCEIAAWRLEQTDLFTGPGRAAPQPVTFDQEARP